MFGISKKAVKFHILCWSIFICYEILFVTTVTGQSSSFGDYFVHYFINIAFFYFHAFFTYPFIISREKPLTYLMLPLLIALEMAAYLFLMMLLSLITQYISDKFILMNEVYYLRYLWRGLYFLIFSTGFYYVELALKNEQKISKLEIDKANSALYQEKLRTEVLQSENAWRQSQINPHFLFNSLNLIYNNINTISPEGGKSIMMLSQIMRHCITPLSSKGKIRLTDEIEHIELFIKLNQLRFDGHLNVNFKVSGNCDNLLINPLLLITLVENIYKHADLYNINEPAQISIEVSNGILDLTTRNLILSQPTQSHGIGLKNITERLRSYYLNCHEFNYKTDDNIFTLNLMINLL